MSQHDFHAQQTRDRGILGASLERLGFRHIWLAASIVLVTTALLLPGFSWQPLRPLPLSVLDEQQIARIPRQDVDLGLADNPLSTSPEPAWQIMTVRSGETLAMLFRKAGISPGELYRLMLDKQTARLIGTIHPGRQLYLSSSESGQLLGLRYEVDALNTLVVSPAGDAFSLTRIERPVQTRTLFATGRIDSSLFAAGEKAGISDALVMELANVFGYDIDFALDLRSGDHFSIVYDEQLVDGVPYGSGTILAAEFVNDGRAFSAVRYVNQAGDQGYYAPDGKSLRKAFLRAPLQFSRISSSFSLSRLHPILNTIRAHKGVDYAAPSGTPVYAAGDGRVSFVGTRGGYGRLVALQHGSQFETHYAHLSRFAAGISAGGHVHQGQIIGYVGSSGLATAPHLHYEFLVNGVHRNPRTIVLPQAEPIPAGERERFLNTIQSALQQLQNQNRALFGQTK